MTSPAYLPLFPADYLADTQHLSAEEHGAYLLLMMTAWLQDDCGLPDDDRKLSRITRLSLRKWKACRPTMLEFWRIENGRWFHAARCTQPHERKTLSLIVRREVSDRDGEQCVYCKTTEGPFEFDHIIPWSQGGKDTVENLCIACFPCNRAKRDRTPAHMGWAWPPHMAKAGGA